MILTFQYNIPVGQTNATFLAVLLGSCPEKLLFRIVEADYLSSIASIRYPTEASTDIKSQSKVRSIFKMIELNDGFNMMLARSLCLAPAAVFHQSKEGGEF